jgi:hypothetical protein
MVDSLTTLVVDADFVNSTNGGYLYIDIIEDSMNMPSFFGDVNPTIGMTFFAKIGDLAAFNHWKETVLVNANGNPGDDMAVMRVIDKIGPTTTTTRTITMEPAVDPNGDEDGDGDINSNDCNVFNPAVHHGAVDIPNNGIDEDCSGSDNINDGILDQDGDGMTPNEGDCNDHDKTIYKDAPDALDDGIDQDCHTVSFEYKTVPSSDIVKQYDQQIQSSNTINVSETFALVADASEADGDWYTSGTNLWQKRAVYVPAGVDEVNVDILSSDSAADFRVHVTNDNVTVHHALPVNVTDTHTNTTTGEKLSNVGAVSFKIDPASFNRDNSGGYIYFDLIENPGANVNKNVTLSVRMHVANTAVFENWKNNVRVHFNGDSIDGNPIASSNSLIIVDKTAPTPADLRSSSYITQHSVLLPSEVSGATEYQTYIDAITQESTSTGSTGGTGTGSTSTGSTGTTTTDTTCHFWESCYTGGTTSSGGSTGGSTTTSSTSTGSTSTSSTTTSSSSTCHFWESCYTGSTSSSTTTGGSTTTSNASKGAAVETADDKCNFWEDCDSDDKGTSATIETVVEVDKAEHARVAVEAVRAKEYTFQGVFSSYAFTRTASDPFNWVFIDPAGNAYQLHGNTPNSRDVFGWKATTIEEEPTPNWYMFSLGEDIDGDGSTKFDWVIVSADSQNKQAYKLAGATDKDTFLYSERLDVDYELSEDRTGIVFQ